MGRVLCRTLTHGLLLWMILPLSAAAQTATYHLHREASSTSGLFQLKAAGPDSTRLAIQTIDLQNQPTGEYLVEEFDTQSGVPSAAGAIVSGSTVSFTVWMKKTGNFGAAVPRARVRVNNAAGALLCQASGGTYLTTTLTAYTLSCTTGANIVLAASDRFYLWVGVNV